MFTSYCYSKAGSDYFRPGHTYAYVPYMVRDAVAKVNGLSLTSNPRAGDLVVYDWNTDRVGDHVEMFSTWTKKNSTFDSIGGNTSTSEKGSQSNGGMVARKGRAMTNVETAQGMAVFIRVAG